MFRLSFTIKAALVLSFSFFCYFFLTSPSSVSAQSFNQNNLIDDSVYNNTSAMSVDQINNFLNSFPDSCLSPNSGFYTPDPTGWSSSVMTNHGYTFGDNVTAGQAIYDAAQIYDINPEVLLSTMQKEQSVVTGSVGCHYTNPSPGQACTYSGGGCVFIAMSYACPSGCDTTYSSTSGTGFNGIGNTFSLQLIAATWFLRWSQERAYGNLTGYWGYDPGDENIYYGGPMTAGNRSRVSGGTSTYYDGSYTLSDSTSITIGDGATAALYYYTPFISGNTNFDNLFNQWFGSVYGTYAAQFMSQAYNPIVEPGQSASVYIQYKNVGTAPWYDNDSNYAVFEDPVHLATDDPLNRNSIFSASWPNSDRPANTFGRVLNSDGSMASNQHVVQPGQVAEFWFAFNTSFSTPPGTYIEAIRPVVEGLGPMNDTGTYFTVTVNPRSYVAQYYSQSNNLIDFYQGDTQTIDFEYKNVGNDTWFDSNSAPASEPPIHLSTDYPVNRSSNFYASGWAASWRPAINFAAVYDSDGTTLASNQDETLPGQIAKFQFNVYAPLGLAPGYYPEAFRPVAEGYGSMNEIGTYVGITVNGLSYSAKAAGQAYNPTIQQGSDAAMYMKFLNTGSTTWYDDTSSSGTSALPVHLATDNPLNRNSLFSATWPFPSRPDLDLNQVYAPGGTLAADQHEVLPGETAEYWFALTATCGITPGVYSESFRPVVEGYGPMNNTGTYFTVTVTPGGC